MMNLEDGYIISKAAVKYNGDIIVPNWNDGCLMLLSLKDFRKCYFGCPELDRQLMKRKITNVELYGDMCFFYLEDSSRNACVIEYGLNDKRVLVYNNPIISPMETVKTRGAFLFGNRIYQMPELLKHGMFIYDTKKKVCVEKIDFKESYSSMRSTRCILFRGKIFAGVIEKNIICEFDPISHVLQYHKLDDEVRIDTICLGEKDSIFVCANHSSTILRWTPDDGTTEMISVNKPMTIQAVKEHNNKLFIVNKHEERIMQIGEDRKVTELEFSSKCSKLNKIAWKERSLFGCCLEDRNKLIMIPWSIDVFGVLDMYTSKIELVTNFSANGISNAGFYNENEEGSLNLFLSSLKEGVL